MPSYDKLHKAVVEALEKAGWRVGSQLWLRFARRRVWIDIQAIHPRTGEHIFVEVKGFEHRRSEVDYLVATYGQIAFYRAALDDYGLHGLLYLAVPQSAMHGILSEKLGIKARDWGRINLMIFDPEREEVIQWMPYSTP